MAPEKSVACIFSRRKFALPDYLVFEPHRIPCKPFVRYLGIYIDSRLDWKIHINNIAERGEKALNLLRALCGTKWGADPNTMLLFYKNCIRSILDFGSIFYGSATTTNLNKINVLKNKCIRLCLGYLKSTPVQVLQAESCDPPLHLRHRYLAERFILKLHAYDNPLLLKIHNLAIDSLHTQFWHNKKLPLLLSSYLYILEFKDQIHTAQVLPCFELSYESLLKPVKTFTLPNYKKVGNNAEPIFKHDISSRWPTFDLIFTDGSKSQDKAGCAFFHQNLDYFESTTLSPEVTVFTAELLAIKFALSYCVYKQFQSVIILTDSKSSVEALASPASLFKSSTNYLLHDINKLYRDLEVQNKTVIVGWLQSHCGIVGNEKADSLAKQASSTGHPQPDIKIPYTDFVSKIKKKLREQWTSEYDSSLTGKMYKSYQPKLPRRPWFKDSCNRHFITTVSRMRANHGLFQSHKYRIGLTNTQDCICGEIADLQHLIIECSNSDHDDLLNKLRKLNIQFPINLASLLALNRIDIYNILYIFTLENSIFI